VRIFAFTDFHGNQEAFQRARQTIANEKPDLVLVAGDIVNHDVERAKRFLADLAEAGSPVYFVPGNMDGVELITWSGTESVRALHGRCETWQNVALIGLGGSPRGTFTTPIEYSEEAGAEVLERALTNYHGGNMILVSHCPPKETKADRVMIGQHIGSSSVRKFVEKMKPMIVVSGHVHEARGVDRIGPTVVVNAGPARSGNYAIIDMKKNVDVVLAKFM
jgi:Icc-related predicted phosphoesterase